MNDLADLTPDFLKFLSVQLKDTKQALSEAQNVCSSSPTDVTRPDLSQENNTLRAEPDALKGEKLAWQQGRANLTRKRNERKEKFRANVSHHSKRRVTSTDGSK